MKQGFVFASILGLQLAAQAQVIEIRYQESGLTEYHDVQIYKWDTDESDGASGVVEYNENHMLLKFGGVEVPAGLYDLDLQIKLSSVSTPGDMRVYFLTDYDWADPGTQLNPPSASSLNPTWSHINYNSRAWSTPGAVGGAEANQLMDSKTISTAGVHIFDGTSVSMTSQADFAFAITMQTSAVMYTKESAPTNTYLPTLRFTLIESYEAAPRFGGLDWNGFFYPFHLMR